MAPLPQVLETGVPAIDAGNEGLRFLLERMFEPGVECRRGHGGRGECDFSSCSRIEAILRYVARNFTRQEEVMAEGGYPEAERHQSDHASLLVHLEVMLRGHVCAEKDAAKVRDFVAHWASEHALRCDHPFGRWAVTRRVLDPKR